MSTLSLIFNLDLNSQSKMLVDKGPALDVFFRNFCFCEFWKLPFFKFRKYFGNFRAFFAIFAIFAKKSRKFAKICDFPKIRVGTSFSSFFRTRPVSQKLVPTQNSTRMFGKKFGMQGPIVDL